VGDDTWLQNNFGIFVAKGIDESQGWIFHHTHGWLWVASEELENLWMFAPSDGWLWTSNDVHPYVYLLNEGWLYYLQGTSNPRWFYSVEQAAWINLPLGYTVTDYFSRQLSPAPLSLVDPQYPEGFEAVPEG